MPIRSRSSRSFFRQVRPRISTSPESGVVKPSRISIVVVFPAPFGPRRPKHSPLSTDRSSPSTAFTSGKYLRRLRQEMTSGIWTGDDTLAAVMRAIVFDHFGDESTLRIGEVESPVVAPDELRIRVRATAVNRADLLQREGHYPPPPGAFPILGLECTGEVIEVGADVRGWTIGDRAMALLAGGGYAEEVVVHHGSAIHVPDALTDQEAGAMPEVFLT